MIVTAAASLGDHFARQATNWSVMTDELQVARLALSIAETLSPLPQIHGETYGAPNQLYPILLAPLFGLLSVPGAVEAAHGVNAILFTSAAWPAYLVARAVSGSRAVGYVAAAWTAFTPWLVLSTTLLTENAAYPAFAWALFFMYRSLVAPGAGRDAATLAVLGLALLARTQLVVLVAVFPLAIAVHELGSALSAAPPGGRRRALRTAARRSVAAHRPLLIAYGAAALLAGVVLALAGLRQLFGTYQEAFRGDLLPAGMWGAAADLLAYVAVGAGVAPFLLACSFVLSELVTPTRREAHAFAALLAVLIPLVTLQVASFNVRFTPGAFVQDRYLCYLAPAFAVAGAAALVERERRGLRAVLLLVATVVGVALTRVAPFPPSAEIFWAAPASAFHDALTTAGGWIGVSADELVPAGVALVGVTLAAVAWRAPGRRALAVVGTVVATFGLVQAAYVFEQVALPITTRGGSTPMIARDWVDELVAKEAPVALVPNPVLRPDYWWDVEFWNRSVDRVVQTEGTTYTPFPVAQMQLDFATGAVRGVPRRWVVVATADSRFRLAGTTILEAPPLALVRLIEPHRAEWATRGLHPDGWTRAGKAARLRVFATRGSRFAVAITLSAPREAENGIPVAIEAAGRESRRFVRRGRSDRLDITLCVRRGGFGQTTLRSGGSVRIADGRRVGVHVDAIKARSTGRPC